jgi:DNA-binding IclR family transcriptional regulator
MPAQSVSHTVKQGREPDPQLTRLTHQSLERGLRVLETVAANGGLNSLAETARRTGLHRSTAHHLLQTLVGLGYLRQDTGTRAYELTAKLFQLTGRTWTPEQIGVIAEPILSELTLATGEASSLATYRDGAITIVAKRESDGPVRVVQDLGAERPVHATAVGKAIVAWLPATELAGVLARTRFSRFTPRTLASRTAFEAELRRIRESGFAIDDEEHHEGIRCIAAPVFAFNGQAMASLCAVGPKSSMTRQKLRDVRAPLRALARTLSERLGWTSESLKNA